MKKIFNSCFIVIFAIIMATYPIYVMAIKGGILGHVVRAREPGVMYAELIVWFLIAIAGIKIKNVGWITVELFVFTYLHMMLLPVLASIIYALLICLIGWFVQSQVFKDNEFDIHSIMLGMIVISIVYALLSLIKQGSVLKLQIVDAIILCILIIFFLRKRISVRNILINPPSFFKVDSLMYIQLCIIMVFMMLIIGRVNLSLDYDSAWYGARSIFCLDNKTGIYDNLKLVGCVYTYPKGVEILMLPLSSVKTHAGVYAGNMMVAVGILYVAYRICSFFVPKERAVWGAVLVAAIPGIMNMALTAKPDCLTLFVQLLMIYYGISFIRNRSEMDFAVMLAAYIYSMTLKPTASVFSTSILLAFIFIQIIYRIAPKFNKKGVQYICFSAVVLFFVWLRTYLITGIPAGSIWGKLFRKMGMTEKYPYAVGQISQFRTGDLLSEDVIIGTIQRIKEFLIAPNSADSDHVALAWGTSLCSFLIIIMLVGGILSIRSQIKRVKEDASYMFVWVLIVGELVGCILSLWVLSKPDGNYFMLYYSVTTVGAVILVDHFLKYNMLKKISVVLCLIIFVPTNIFLTGAATWGWVCQFTEFNWINRGYWDIEKSFRLYMKSIGCDRIYKLITKDPSTKVFAYGLHPDIERIPCVIESETDVSFWGNYELTASYENFLEFVDYEDYDYILIQPGYLNAECGAYYYLCNMIDAYYFEDMIVENEYILFKLRENDCIKVNSMKEEFIALFEK